MTARAVDVALSTVTLLILVAVGVWLIRDIRRFNRRLREQAEDEQIRQQLRAGIVVRWGPSRCLDCGGQVAPGSPGWDGEPGPGYRCRCAWRRLPSWLQPLALGISELWRGL